MSDCLWGLKVEDDDYDCSVGIFEMKKPYGSNSSSIMSNKDVFGQL